MTFSKTLLRGTRKVHECLANSANGAPRQSRWLAAGFRESCTALGDLVIDPEFRLFLRHTSAPMAIKEAMVALDEYRKNQEDLDIFLNAERELFQRAGLPLSASDHLVNRCRSVIVAGRYDERIELAYSLAELQNYVCQKADQLETGLRRGILGGLLNVFGGLTVAVLNGGLLAATVGLSGAASAASVLVGGVIAADGYTTVRKIY